MQIGGALTTQRPAGEALADCLFHGARLSRAAAGAVRIDVDALADHTAADIELGAGDPAGWNNFQLDGVQVNRNLPDGYQLFGLYDPGFPNQGETWGAYAPRGETAGNILQQYAPYIADTVTLDREAHYRWHRIQQRKTIVEGRDSDPQLRGRQPTSGPADLPDNPETRHCTDRVRDHRHRARPRLPHGSS